MENLQVGQKAPDFIGVGQDGKEIKLSDFRGKKLILYFYPKDATPGCTSEACSLRDGWEDLRAAGFSVVGVSADDETSHKRFIEKHSLPFALISDPDKAIIKAYDAWGEKSMYGKKYMGIIRKTYVIDENGVIEMIVDKVKVKDSANQILENLKK